MLARTGGETVFVYVAMILCFLSAVVRDADSASDFIYIKNSSSSSVMLQITDDVCRRSFDIECDNARTALLSQECMQNIPSPACNAARNIVDTKCSCVQARKTLNQAECRNSLYSPECRDAQSKAASSSCLERLIFEGTVKSGASIPLTACFSSAGYSSVSIKEPKNSFWKSYRLINPGDTVSYP